MDETNQDQHQVRGVRRGRKPREVAAGDVVSPAQALALRIWEGQSPDLPRWDREARCRAGVERQGMSFDGVRLPDVA